MFDFRPLATSDFPMLARWFQAPHARAWYGESLAEIEAEYAPIVFGEVAIQSFIVTLEGRPVGLIECNRLGDHPECQRAYEVEDPDTANVDVILGEPDAAHRGLGPIVIREFLVRVVFADPRIKSCVIDPEAGNHVAIRAYEKAGFRFVRAMADDNEGNSVYLLELRREELATAPAEPPFYLRPARAAELDAACAIDDDACAAYAAIGIDVELPAEHPFALAERERWRRSIEAGCALFACHAGEPVGFAAFGWVDGLPFLHQVSVRQAWGRRGVGTALVERVKRWSVQPGELRLTTYDHVPWNRAWYERLGFAVCDSDNAGAH